MPKERKGSCLKEVKIIFYRVIQNYKFTNKENLPVIEGLKLVHKGTGLEKFKLL